MTLNLIQIASLETVESTGQFANCVVDTTARTIIDTALNGLCPLQQSLEEYASSDQASGAVFLTGLITNAAMLFTRNIGLWNLSKNMVGIFLQTKAVEVAYDRCSEEYGSPLTAPESYSTCWSEAFGSEPVSEEL